EDHERDAALRALIDVVPFGIDPDPPKPSSPRLRGTVPGIEADDFVLLWPGGIWEWFDPLTVIRAVKALQARAPKLRLYFLGLTHPDPGVGRMSMTERAIAEASALGITDRAVFFNKDWIPYH